MGGRHAPLTELTTKLRRLQNRHVALMPVFRASTAGCIGGGVGHRLVLKMEWNGCGAARPLRGGHRGRADRPARRLA